MSSEEPSGHTILKVVPGGRDENGAPLVARYTAAAWLAPLIRISCGDCAETTEIRVRPRYFGLTVSMTTPAAKAA
jgi:hypothetical protein